MLFTLSPIQREPFGSYNTSDVIGPIGILEGFAFYLFIICQFYIFFTPPKVLCVGNCLMVQNHPFSATYDLKLSPDVHPASKCDKYDLSEQGDH